MAKETGTCFTLEAALEKAIELEDRIYRQFLDAIRAVRNQGARQILREAALAELVHKHHLETALLNEDRTDVGLDKQVPIMDLDHRFGVDKLTADADSRTALAHAIHLVNTSVRFYQMMTEACSGAPMASVFARIGNEQRQHLQKLEDTYEEHFLTEN